MAEITLDQISDQISALRHYHHSMATGWADSNRASRLPPDWERRRRRILRRDHHTCQLRYPGCTIAATEIDHADRGDDHSDDNLQAACRWCHARKSSAEGNAAHKPRPSRRRPAEPHPGLI